MNRLKIISPVIVSILFTMVLLNQKKVQAFEGDYEYYKKAYFGFSVEGKFFNTYWMEECTPYIGSQCAQPGGAFRTLVATVPIPQIPVIKK